MVFKTTDNSLFFKTTDNSLLFKTSDSGKSVSLNHCRPEGKRYVPEFKAEPPRNESVRAAQSIRPCVLIQSNTDAGFHAAHGGRNVGLCL